MEFKTKSASVMYRDKGNGRLYVDNVFVFPEHRQKGQGKKVVKDFISKAKKDGYKVIYLNASNEMGSNLKRLKGFYKNLGFTYGKKKIQGFNDINFSLKLNK